MKFIVSTVFASLLAIGAQADTVPGNYSWVSGSNCPSSQNIILDLEKPSMTWWQTVYTPDRQCSKDDSQLNTPEFCSEAEFDHDRVTTTDSQRTYIFGIIPNPWITVTTSFDFSPDFQTVIVTANGDGEHSLKYQCKYQRTGD